MLWAGEAVAAGMTATYMFRIMFLTFHGERREDTMSMRKSTLARRIVHDAPSSLWRASCPEGAGGRICGGGMRRGYLCDWRPEPVW